jgi:hypothetical protein
VGLEVFETDLLKRSVRTYVECVRLTEAALEPQLLEIDFDAAADTFSADALMSTLRPGDVQVHIRAFAEKDLMATREATDRRAARSRRSRVVCPRTARTRAGNVRAKHPVLADESDPRQASRDARVLSDVSSR